MSQKETNLINEVAQTPAAKVVKPRGRPSAFNHDDALAKAQQLFWTYGFEGTSMADLTEALGINKPSLYAAFGNKEELFRKAIGRYLSGPAAYVATALQASTAYEVAEALLNNAVEVMTHPEYPGGCMVVQSALTCGQGAHLVQQELAARRQQFEQALQTRFARAQQDGDLTSEVDTAALAKYLATVHQGMSVQASSGAKAEALRAVAKIALLNWPR